MYIGRNPFLPVWEEQTESPVFKDQQIFVNLNIKLQQRFTNTTGRDYIYASLLDHEGMLINEKKWVLPETDATIQDDETEFDIEFPFNINQGGSYLINIGFGDLTYGHITNSNKEYFTSVPIEVSAFVKYVTGMNENEGIGIRIKRVSDYASENDTSPNIRRFYYSSLKDYFLNKKENRIIQPYFYTAYNEVRLCRKPGQVLPIRQDNLFLTLNSKPTFVTNFKDGRHKMSQFVTTSLGGDNFEKGAIEKKFLVNQEKEIESYHKACGRNNSNCIRANSTLIHDRVKITSSSSYNGLVEDVSYWDNRDGKLFKVKSTSIKHQIVEDTIQHNAYFTRNGFDSTLNHNDYLLGLYMDLQVKKTKEISKEINYIDPVPITAYFPHNMHYPNGWPLEDDDNDGVLNYQDTDFIPPSQSEGNTNLNEIEESYKKIITKSETKYHDQIAGEVKKLKVFYDQTDSLALNYKYPIDLPSQPYVNQLLEKHIVNKPLVFEKKKNDNLIEKNRIIYGNKLLPKEYYKSKGNLQEQKIMSYNSYDNVGNITKYTIESGIPVTIFWGYHNQYPILKIEGEFQKPNEELLSSIIMLSNTRDNIHDELLITRMAEFRNLPQMKNTMITSYTYNPLIGVTSITPPNGQTVYYEYDGFGRLKTVKDEAGNKVQDIQYKYRATP